MSERHFPLLTAETALDPLFTLRKQHVRLIVSFPSFFGEVKKEQIEYSQQPAVCRLELVFLAADLSLV